MEFPTRMVQEGAASFLIPQLVKSSSAHTDRSRSRAPVFYNPRMALNRDSAVLVIGAYQSMVGRELTVCEPMCGTGIRGIRLAIEVDEVRSVTLGDLNPSAIRLAMENARLNDVSEKVTVRLIEANTLLALHSKPLNRFDYVDIDPYGSPAPFLDSAVRACNKGGLIALTATDMAPLCGVYPRACLRKYGGLPLRVKYSKEVALRLIVGALVTAASRHELSTRPVFSFATDHYARVYALVDRGAKKVDACLKEIGFIVHDYESMDRVVVPLRLLRSMTNEQSSADRAIAGPLWLGELADASFCEDMLRVSERSYASSNRRLMAIVEKVKGGIGFPVGSYDLDTLCSKLKMPSMNAESVISTLRERGFKAVISHINQKAIKTDASGQVLISVMREVASTERN